MQIILKIFILLVLLYPAAIGFIFNSRKPKPARKVAYGLIAVCLAIFNMIVVVATYYGAFLSDSWLTFISFFVFQILLLVSVIVHIVMVVKDDYSHKFAKTMAVLLLFFGVLFSLFLILFSRPEVTSGEGISVSNSLLTMLPALFSSSFFILTGTSNDVFVSKKKMLVKTKNNKRKPQK